MFVETAEIMGDCFVAFSCSKLLQSYIPNTLYEI